MTICWPPPGFKKRTLVSCRFSTKGNLISAPAVPTAGEKQKGGWSGGERGYDDLSRAIHVP